MKQASKKPKTERNKNIKRAITAGSSYRDIGKRYGISAKRVFEVVNKPHAKKKSSKK